MVYLITFIFLTYLILVVVLITSGYKVLRQKTIESSPHLHVLSVIVPVRNEEENIGLLLQDLANQKYQAFEVIVVDDHSNDNTIGVVNKIIGTDNRFKLIKNSREGKKQALTDGIKASRGAIIVTTDADCRVNGQWLSIINRYFQQTHIKLLMGGVRIQQTGTFFSNMQALEFSSLIGSAAATLALGFPTMCNGANLAFRKSVFEEVNGYEGNLHIPSGDDEFLMRKVFRKYKDGISFCNNAEAVVATSPAKSVLQFVQQRIRWAGKWRFNSSFFSKALAFFILIMQLSFVLMLLQFMKSQDMLWGTMILMKVIFEGIFIFSVCRFLKVRWHWSAFILLQFIYPLYVTSIGLFSTLLPYSWKGRKIQSAVLAD